jgi:lipopolysaccharide/colanic/teichoic acid biosynthesis glycosyltransferase
MSDGSMSLDRVETILSDQMIGASLYRGLRHAADTFAAAILLIATSPLFLIMAVLVKLTSRGPVIYSQKRVGLNGAVFTIYKIRSMTDGCERQTGACWSKPGDARVTPVGRFLRKTHLDELPQLWNVLSGEMSLIGPRPERPEFVVQLERQLPDYRHRLDVAPGITGLAQVLLPPDTDIESVRRKLDYDLYYIQHVGPWLDLSILIGTVLHIVGVPARITRLICGLPSPETVHAGHGTLPEGPEAEPVAIAA